MILKGKIAWVTGGAIRVGKEIALALAGHGANVAISYLSSQKEAEKTLLQIRETGRKSCAVHGNVSKKQDVERMAREIEETLGPIDILVNNASIFKPTPWPDISEDEWNQNIDIHLKGAFLCAQATAPGMTERRRGKIVNIVDWAVDRPYKNYLPYLTSKAGLIGFTKALAKELAPHVQVNGVAPGPVLLPQEMSEKERQAVIQATPLKRQGSPEDIASAVLFLVEGTDYATGSILVVDGGRLIG